MKRVLFGGALVVCLVGSVATRCSAVALAQADAGADAAAPPAAPPTDAAADAGPDSVAPQPGIIAERPALLPGDRRSLPSVHVTGPPECPTAEELVADLEASEGRLRLQPVTSGPADYEVQFRPWSGRYDAEIKDEAGRVRSLEGSDCGELARATGLSLLMLVDAAPARLPAVQEPEWTPAGRIPEEPNEEVRWQSRFGASLGLGGVLAPHAVVGAYGRFTGVVELSTWFLYQFGSSIKHGPGRVDLSWLGFGSDVCYLFFDLFGVCGGGWVGRLSAEGQGYDRNSSVARWQPGLSFGVRVHQAFSEHWEAGMTTLGMLALTEEKITVANVEGDAFTTWRLMPLITLELGAHF
ncbi:MAG: hypothetical protein H6718_32210 [Polyangiaceae bacterium]|nr:hypothetical protein [Polyangiaceae bacterium]MCB9608002.1 hypothetical protein [Polyangiaceae bacterium]